MDEKKTNTGFIAFFFFFQGIFMTGMILFAIYNNKIIPCIKDKNTQIELLLQELNKTMNKNHNHSDNYFNKNPFRTIDV